MEDKLSREQVKQFLSELQRYLQSRLPARGVVVSTVTNLKKGAGSTVWGRRKPEGPETGFIGEYLLPNVEEFVQRTAGAGTANEPRSLLRVGCAVPSKFTHSGFAFFPGHPFSKAMRKPEDIYTRWVGQGKKGQNPLIQSWPDFTLLAPYRILFECKYFTKRLKNPAKLQLVTDLYETFFYRALPQRLPNKKEPQGWNYEYACYVAYDATDEGWLKRAWAALPQKLRDSFWEQANIFVIMLPGDSTPPESVTAVVE